MLLFIGGLFLSHFFIFVSSYTLSIITLCSSVLYNYICSHYFPSVCDDHYDNQIIIIIHDFKSVGHVVSHSISHNSSLEGQILTI